jgi:hypothetical protein
MTQSGERKILASLLRQIDYGPHGAFQSAWFVIVIWIAIAALFFVLFQAGDRVDPLVLALVSLFVGALAGVFGFCKASAKQWPVVQPHVTRESIVARLSQLGP